ncbi:MAG: CPBP family intramembrane metalloprotease [Verrucomicrobia bacterium]|nr:CPBP family intramembrane metalloprotease [Verrucomicrobiota bacterium]
MIATYAVLALAVLALWLPGAGWRRHAWLLLFAASLVAALLTGVVAPVGLVAVGGLAVAAWLFSRPEAGRAQRVISGLALVGLATVLMLHRAEGFNNPRVIDAVRFTPDALPFTLYLNFDKTLVGLFILGWCHARLTRAGEWRAMLAALAPRAGALIALIMVLSLAMGYVRFAPKLPAETLLWLGVNLLFTCMAEEALFRGFVQAQLQRAWQNVLGGSWLALGVAAVLFGLAHAAGGAAYVALATVAGLGYGWIYRHTRSIEASILAHFTLNTVHFLAFTYPALAAGR